ncbi:hypothetical protein BDQ17DRAFT_1196352, partial [Cyathus striatus]
KKRKKNEACARKEVRQAKDVECHLLMSTNHVFMGSLDSKKKGELEDIALVLRLLTTGSKSEIQAQIVDYFESHPQEKESARFSSLFNTHQGHCAMAEPHPTVPIPSSSSYLLPQVQPTTGPSHL